MTAAGSDGRRLALRRDPPAAIAVRPAEPATEHGVVPTPRPASAPQPARDVIMPRRAGDYFARRLGGARSDRPETPGTAPLGPGRARLDIGEAGDAEERAAEATARAVSQGRAQPRPSASQATTAPDPGFLAALGPAAPLPAATRHQMEQAFRRDLGHVQLHATPQAERVAAGLNAQAFAVGRHIAFGRGQLMPGTWQGVELIAHEIAHVLAGGSRLRRQVVGYAELGQTPGQELRAAALRAYRHAIEEQSRAEFRRRFLAEFQDFVDSYYPDDRGARLMQKAETLVDRSIGMEEDEPKDAFHLFGALGALESQASSDELATAATGSLGLSHAVTLIAEDAAILLLKEVEPNTFAPMLDIGGALETIDRAARSAEFRYQLELEATMVALLEARQAWNQAPPNARQQPRARVAMLSRRLLLLDAAIRGVRQIPPDRPAALEQALHDTASRIASIREASRNEATTLSQLGDDPSLLAPRELDAIDPLSAVAARHHDEITSLLTVEPDIALPRTTDVATASMVRNTAAQITARRQEADRLRAAVLPTPPTYTLEEFSAVHRRWFAFMSPEEEQRNPAFAFIAGFFRRDLLLTTMRPDLKGEERRKALEQMRSPYELLGIEGRFIEKASFSVARYMALSILAPLLARAMGSPNTQFARELGALGTERGPLLASGSASDIAFSPQVRHRLPTAGGTTRDVAQATSQWTADRAARFSAVAAQPSTGPQAGRMDLIRLYGPRGAGMPQPDAPIVGLRAVDAREGWAYLIDVPEMTTGATEVAAREQKVMPPEVVNYLAAAHAANVMSRGPLQPKATTATGDEVPIGDRPTRTQGGLAAASASATRDLLGEDALGDERQAFERDRAAIAAAQQAGPSNPTEQLVVDLQRYLDGYFAHHQTAVHRFAGVLAIAAHEHDLARQAKAAISPEHIGEVASFTLKLQLATRALSSRGLLGRIMADGLGAYFRSKGAGEIASAVGVMTFLWEVRNVSSLSEARAWGYILPAIFDDFTNLMDAVVARGVGAATDRVLSRLVDGPVDTPRQMGDAARGMAADPATHREMLAAVDAELAQLGQAGRHSSPEYRALEAFRHELVVAGQRPATHQPLNPDATRALDEPVPGMTSAASVPVPFDMPTPRPAAERAALDATIPPDLRGRVRIVEDPLLSVGRAPGDRTEVRVVASEREVQIRVARDATPDAVRAHVDIARDLVRFTGTAGRLRRLLARIQDRLGLQTRPGPHQRGFEAEREIAKLTRMAEDLRARQAWLERAESDVERGPGLSSAERERLDLEIASIERQIAYHARDLGSFEAGRGYIASADRQRSIQQTVEAALVDGGLPRAAATAQAQRFVRDARSQRVLDAVEDLANAGSLARIARAGAPLDTVLSKLRTEGGYGELIQADTDPSAARRLFGDDVAQQLHARRTAAPAQGAAGAAASVAAEWPVDPVSGTYDASRLPPGWTVQRIGQVANRSVPPPADAPRLVFRRWRYVQTRSNPLPFAEWVKLGYQANLNRDVSSPHEWAAVTARGAFPNNAPESEGGRREYDYEEWTTDGVSQASRRERGRGRRGETLRYATTRPDGIRPRVDGGFDVVEHKHMTGAETVLHDSIQFRAQREMANVQGRGEHEIVITTDHPARPDGKPGVQPSEPLGRQSKIFFLDLTTGRITYRWDPSTASWVEVP